MERVMKQQTLSLNMKERAYKLLGEMGFPLLQMLWLNY